MNETTVYLLNGGGRVDHDHIRQFILVFFNTLWQFYYFSYILLVVNTYLIII